MFDEAGRIRTPQRPTVLQKLRRYLARIFWAVLGLPPLPDPLSHPRPGVLRDPAVAAALRQVALSDPDPELQALALERLQEYVGLSYDRELPRQLAEVVMTTSDYLVQQYAYRCLLAHHLHQFHVGAWLGGLPSPFLIDWELVRRVAGRAEPGRVINTSPFAPVPADALLPMPSE